MTSIQAAITLINGDVATILVGPGVYKDGPYDLKPGTTLKGSGSGTGSMATLVTLDAPPSPQSTPYIKANNATVGTLRVQLASGSSTGSVGLSLTGGASVRNVIAVGSAGATGAVGVETTSSVLDQVTLYFGQAADTTAVLAHGGNTLADSTWNGVTAYRQNATTGTDKISRVVLRGTDTGASVEAGLLNIDNSLVDLGSSGTVGITAVPTAPATASTVEARQLTVVGGAAPVGGSASSWGVLANGSKATAGTLRTATVTLANSVVVGPGKAVDTRPGTYGQAKLTVLNTAVDDATLDATVTNGGNNLLSVSDPGFIDGAGGNYALRVGATVVDKGASNWGTDYDITGGFRPFDGDRNGSFLPDLGAYELTDVTPAKSSFTSGPTGPTKNRTPVFQFKVSEPGATQLCRVDSGTWLKNCTSPATTAPLADGPHSFQIYSVDKVGNVESPPVVRNFVVDTDTPNTTITKKPPKKFTKKRVKFKFTTSEPGAKLQCNLDRRGWKTCQSTYRLNVKFGKHKIQVRAVDEAGNIDPTPAQYTYRRIKPRHR
ncbi:MAG TPA: hypothetical protein DEQ43_26265 [Nocardioides bacterium]|nr:hypothetical protein [Nocardioides sp.]